MMLDVDLSKMQNHFVKHIWLALFMILFIFTELYLVIYASRGFIPMPTQFFNSDITNTEAIGSLLFTDYFIAFQMSGAVLLVAMIGAIVLTIRHAKQIRRQDISKQVSRTRQESVAIAKVQTGEGVKLP
jgi:NADH-quinone oxidoreductase subunit J